MSKFIGNIITIVAKARLEGNYEHCANRRKSAEFNEEPE